LEFLLVPPLLTLNNINLGLGKEVLFEDVNLALQPNDRLCLIGRNGTGKTTLFRVIAGELEPDGGERSVKTGTRFGLLPQEPDFSKTPSVADFVRLGLPTSERDDHYKIDAMLLALDLDGRADPKALSGGEARRVALAQTLIGEPEVLLLDEPTNHLDLPTIEWVERFLEGYRGAFILISHDRAFLKRLSTACLWLDRGKIRRLDDQFSKFRSWTEEILRQEDIALAKLDKVIARETEWSHKGISARRSRNQGRLRGLQALRQERQNLRKQMGNAALDLERGDSSGKQVILARNVSKTWPDLGRPIVDNFSIRILRGDKVGLIGPNGAGKTTLLKLLTKDIEPDAGTIQHGTNLTPLVIDQKRESLDPNLNLRETLTTSKSHVVVQGREKHVIPYLKEFLFTDTQIHQPVHSLSGGERNRLMLARAFLQPSNFMILDEPTNDLDMETLDLLQELLSNFDGTVLLVSHDRDFLDRIVTSTIALEGDGTALEYAGGYSDYVTQKALSTKGAQVPIAQQKTPKVKPQKETAAPKKLSFKHEHRAKDLANRIPKLESLIPKMEAELASDTLYKDDPKRFNAIAKKLDDVRTELEFAEDEWLEIEALREELR
jgi:ABC transport system ATP-binding/permease protein